MKKRILSCIIAVAMLLLTSAVVYAFSDEELIASNQVEFFVDDGDSSYWVVYSADYPTGGKYWYEVVDGVERSGIKIEKVGERRYKLIPETQEQHDILFGYETVSFGDETYQRVKLQSFLANVESPMIDKRLQNEKKQAEIEAKNRIINAEKSNLRNSSMNRWASVISSYIYDNGDNTFTVLDSDNKEITLSTYNKSDFSLLDTKNIPFELDIFGGFYSGEKYNYIVFGQENKEENNSKEVIRVVQYDKNFNRIAQASVNNCYTIEPFHSGTVRMAESKNELVIHTSRLRYTTEDGKNHQSQLTIMLDIDTMAVKNELGEFQSNHVSHSFNQFAIYDGSDFVLADLGDAYPRSVVLHKYSNEPRTVTETYTETYENGSRTYSRTYTRKDYTMNLFEIPGEVGANCTGVTVGGLEYSDKNYLVAINTIDHSKVSEYTSFEMKGLDIDERDIVILISGKDNEEASAVKKIYLTDYVGKNKLGSKPYLVKLSDNRFLVLWQEFEYNGSAWNDNGMKYVQLNGNGEIISDIRTDTSLLLSSDCQPALIDNNLMWYIDFQDERKFYNMDLNKSLITVTVNDKIIDFDQPPTIIDGRTLVPLRAIFEALGATVDWNGDTQTVTSKQGKTTITLTINDNKMYKDGKAITLDVPAQMMNDRTLVPVRAVAEAFGCDVDWDSETQKVIITD